MKLSLAVLRSAALLGLLLPSPLFSQGPLPPPGPPAATMKTLDQVEARIPIDATHTAGDDTNEFIIPATGSYYLTGNLNVSKATGIKVAAAGVTIDLNGFAVQRTANSGGTGVRIETTASACVVNNGSIRGFESGVRARPEGDPFSSGAPGGRLHHLTVTNCSGTGVIIGDGWEIADCGLFENGSGIAAGIGGCTIQRCVVQSSTQGAGINLSSGTVIGCVVTRNKGDGIGLSNSGVITDCVAEGNGGNGIRATQRSTISRCTSSFNDANGISGGSPGAVSGCTVFGNDLNGILVSDDAEVLNNTSTQNGRGNAITTGAGIRATGKANQIRGNNTTENDIGLIAEGTGNLIDGNHVRNNTGPGIQVPTVNGRNVIIRNVAGNNVNSYTGIAAGNDLGPVTTVANVTSPVGNIQN